MSYKPLKFQKIAVSQNVNPLATNRTFTADLDENYKYCIGVMFVKKSGAGTNVRFDIQDNNRVIFNPTPLENWDISADYVPKNELFRNAFFPAQGNRINIHLTADTVTKAIDGYFYFLLTMEDVQIPAYELNFQTKRLIVPSGTSAAYQFNEFDLSSQYQTAIGLMVVRSGNIPFLVKVLSESGSVLIDDLYDTIIQAQAQLSYEDRFFPIDILAQGKTVKIEVTPKTPLIADTVLEFIFLLSKPLNISAIDNLTTRKTFNTRK